MRAFETGVALAKATRMAKEEARLSAARTPRVGAGSARSRGAIAGVGREAWARVAKPQKGWRAS